MQDGPDPKPQDALSDHRILPGARRASRSTDFEKIDCPLCHSQNHRAIIAVPDRFSLDKGTTFQIVKCSECDFIYLNPRPKAGWIGEFYKSAEYQPHSSVQGAVGFWDKAYHSVRQYTVSSKRRKIEALKPCGKILDIGCGTAEFLNEMRQHNWHVSGIETDRQAAEFAKSSYGLKVSTSDLNENNYLKKSFDVITLWHALEHLYNPKEALQIVRGLLSDDGIILVAVPNIHSIDAKFYGPNWVALDAPRHLHHFTPATFAALCRAVGLQIFKASQMPFDAYYNCLMSELLTATARKRSKVVLPVFVIRAGLVAFSSTLMSSRLVTASNRQGSSMLYFIKLKL